MFAKSNPAAFPHVMHFLLYNLDPTEFSSRFLWPLYDKVGEKDFRSTCVKYINDLKEKHSLEMDEVGQYIAVVPGGLKFMKVLLSLIKLLQMETLKKHNRTEWLELPPEEIFNAEIRSHAQRQCACMQRMHERFQKTAQREVKVCRKRTDLIKYYTQRIADSFPATDDQTVETQVQEICGKMSQFMQVVSDLEQSCGSVAEQGSNPFERIHLSNAISKITEHHKWPLKTPTNGSASGMEEYTPKLSCLSILDVASKVMRELRTEAANTPVDGSSFMEIVNQNHDLKLFLQNITAQEAEMKVIQLNLKRNEERHGERRKLDESTTEEPVVFPERDYKLVEAEEVDLAAYYTELQRRPEEFLGPNKRLALQDIIHDTFAMSPPTSSVRQFSLADDRSGSAAFLSTRKNLSTTTAKKRTKAMSVLKTISRGKKKSRVNMEALKELAKNGFNDSMLDSSTITWKKSMNASRTEASVGESVAARPAHGRLSGFSESMMPKFNSTAIFNSTTNEQAQQMVFSDITNREAVVVVAVNKENNLVLDGRSPLKQVRRSWFKSHPFLFNCSSLSFAVCRDCKRR